MQYKRMSMEKREGLKGHLFLLPFYIGIILFFIQPLIQSVRFSFSDVMPEIGGYVIEDVGLKNYNYIFLEDPDFKVNLIDGLVTMLWKVPVILICGLLFGILLKRQFRGRLFVRAVFFLPVIIASGIVLDIMQGDYIVSSILNGASVSGENVTGDTFLSTFLQSFLPYEAVSGITVVTGSLFETAWKTGIQTIIFLAGLQGIPSTLYEASAVEGSTAWTDFWKITLPMLIPTILVNTVYTIVDYFTDPGNKAMAQVMANSTLARYGWASAMAWSYFLMIAVILAVIIFLFALPTRKQQ